nr:phosphatase PAP2 family protein [uncultured Butyrivibrio sp.]
MTIDIQYLIMLQDLRNATGGIFNEFFNAISKLAVDLLVFLPYIVFWSVDKKWGYRFISTLWVGEVVNGLIKLTVCAYRPWIRSEFVDPAGDSKVAATGYSFPSGHTLCGTTMYGTTFVWQKDKRRWLAVICGILILLTGFSRNFLGVHTPQDVLVGFLESVVIIFVVGIVSSKIEGNQKMQDILSLCGIIFVICALTYIQIKPYPMDYIEGVLLVDPQRMMNDSFKACGGLLGVCIGNFIERHYVHYEIPVGSVNLPILSCLGLGIMLAWNQWFAGATVTGALGAHWGNLLSYFIMIMFGCVFWPMVIKKCV